MQQYMKDEKMPDPVFNTSELGRCTAEDANAVDEKSCTALHWACSCDEPAVVQLLLADSRVSVEVRSRHGALPMSALCA